MPIEQRETREFSLRQVLPFTQLFRAFSIALDPSKLLLATGAVVLIWFSWWLLHLIFVQPENEFGRWPADEVRGANPFVVLSERPGTIFTSDFWLGSKRKVVVAAGGAEVKPASETKPGEPAKDASEAAQPVRLPVYEKPTVIIRQTPVHLEPFYKFIDPLFGLFKSTPGHLRWWYLLLGMLLTVVIWAVFGGAITRIAALQYARNEKIGMGEALRFAVSKFVHFVTAPLIPFGLMAIIVIIMFIGGLIVNIPWLGDLIAGLLWVLPLLGAVVMAIAILGYVGWPLMYATISTEGSDSFDALSRSYLYVFSRPLHYLWYMCVAIVFGIVVTFFVVFFTSMTVHLARWGVGLASYRSDPDPMQTLFIYAPSSYEWDRLLIVGREHEALSPAEFEAKRESLRGKMGFFPVVSAGIMAFWLHLVFLVMLGFAYSFFWCASTIIYFLLRKRVDDTEMDEVYLEEEDTMPLPPPAAMSPVATTSLPMTDAPKSDSEPVKPESGAGAKSAAGSDDEATASS